MVLEIFSFFYIPLHCTVDMKYSFFFKLQNVFYDASFAKVLQNERPFLNDDKKASHMLWPAVHETQLGKHFMLQCWEDD